MLTHLFNSIRKNIIYGSSLVCLSLLTSCEEKLFQDRSNDPHYIFDSFWYEMDRNYSFFELAAVDWDSVYDAYSPKVSASTTNEELFWIMDEVLSLLNDAHANVYAPVGTGGNSNYFSTYPANPIIAVPEGPYFDHYTHVNRNFGFGKIANSNLAYLRIKTFEGEKKEFEKIDSLLEAAAWCTGLIIDVRSNLGGQISNSEIVASRFTGTSQAAYEYRLRNGPHHTDFTPWYKVNLAPYSKNTWIEKPVALLTNRSSFSATEWFVLFMELQSHVTIVGDTTGGGGSVPITRELPNGWILRIPNTQTRLSSGKIFQRSGIYPDVPVWITKEDEQENIDTILETAIELIE